MFSSPPVPLGTRDAQALWQDFQNGRPKAWESDFSLQIKNGQKEKYVFKGSFKLQGSSNCIASYLKINLPNKKALKVLLLLKEKPEVFLSVGGERPRLLEEKDYLKPLLKEAQLTLKPWDLLMPFLKWKEVNYLGPDRVSGRPAEWFSLKAKGFLGGKLQVRVALDPWFKNLLEVQSIQAGKLWRCLRVRSFQKTEGHFFVKELRLQDMQRGEKLRAYFLRPTPKAQKAEYFQASSFVDAP